eukprot:COSAG01_NODE_3593_length_5898_cov_5.089310_7_plen_155_part_00
MRIDVAECAVASVGRGDGGGGRHRHRSLCGDIGSPCLVIYTHCDPIMCVSPHRVALRVEIRLRAAMEEAVARASTQQAEDGDVFVDRRLVTKLLVNYMGSPSSQQTEILEVMARILQFDDSTKKQVRSRQTFIHSVGGADCRLHRPLLVIYIRM